MLLAQGKFLLGFFFCPTDIVLDFSLWLFFFPRRRDDNDVYKSPVIKDVMSLNLFYVSPHLLHFVPSCELLSMLSCTLEVVLILWLDSANLLVGMVTTAWNHSCRSGGQHCTPMSTFLVLWDCSLWINESLGCLGGSSTYRISLTLSTYQPQCAVSSVQQEIHSPSHCICSDTEGQEYG